MRVEITIVAKTIQILIMSHLLKRLQIHRRLFMQISSSGPSFCTLLQFQQDIAGTLEWPRTGQGWVLNLQGEVARRYLRLNGENMQMNFCPLCNVPKFLVTRFCKTETGS